tara:strand:+ start:19718 stop:20779 length:1062 start_codon:yes stop_codon:yes gene_type:complete
MRAFARAWSSSASSSSAASSASRDGTRTVAMLVPYDGADDGDAGGRFAVYARGREETSVKRREAVEAKRRAMGTTIGARLLRACGWASPKAEETRRRARAFGEKTWAAMGAAKRGSVRKRIHELGMFAMDRIDPREMTLCGMPREASSMEVAYPRGATDARRARRATREAVETGMKNARAATRMYAIGVPLSIPMFLSPVSNFPLYYFVFRLISSTRATAAGGAATALLGDAREERAAEERAMAIEREILEIGGESFACARLDARDGVDVDGAACCRLADPALEKFLRDEGPDALFVPCDALAEAARGHEDSKEKCAAARVEEIFNETGVVELSRKHRRYDEIYGRGANESVY